jgi:hypothetical protein
MSDPTAHPERERALHAGQVHVGWLRGLPYIQEAARAWR